MKINKINILLIIVVIFILILFTCYKMNKDIEDYIPPPIVSKYQNYNWYNIFNPNIGFAPAVHFINPSKEECIEWSKNNFSNSDEAYVKMIECMQNSGSRVKIKNLPISSPGIGEEFQF